MAVSKVAFGRLDGLGFFGREDFRLLHPAAFVNFLLGGEGGIAVEGRVGEVARGGAGVVEDVEPELAVIIPDARAAPDDLLELGHRLDGLVEHDGTRR